MTVRWSGYWNSGDNNDVDTSMDKDGILYIIQTMSPSILKVQPAAVRDAVALVKANSPNIMIIKGLHHIGSEKIDIKKVGRTGGPTIHLYCMNYTLVESGLRKVYDDVIRGSTGWRITGSSVYRGDGNEAYQGMDKTGEIATGSWHVKNASQQEFVKKHY